MSYTYYTVNNMRLLLWGTKRTEGDASNEQFGGRTMFVGHALCSPLLSSRITHTNVNGMKIAAFSSTYTYPALSSVPKVNTKTIISIYYDK